MVPGVEACRGKAKHVVCRARVINARGRILKQHWPFVTCLNTEDALLHMVVYPIREWAPVRFAGKFCRIPMVAAC